MMLFNLIDPPHYTMKRFGPVRDSFDNLSNVLNLVSMVNQLQDSIYFGNIENATISIYSGSPNRAVILKENGYFSMAIPFQVVNQDNNIYFNCDYISDRVSEFYISILRNAISTYKKVGLSHEEIIISISDNFSLEISDATRYCDAFLSLISSDHGYFRFDNDPANEQGKVHPRYHLDFYFKDHCAIKIGLENHMEACDASSLFLPDKEKLIAR